MRSAAGAITTFSAPGAGTGLNQGTVDGPINTGGLAVGYSLDSGTVAHGLLRTATGSLVIFNAPCAGKVACSLANEAVAPGVTFD